MARWEPDARGRLVRAAMELYRERGFDRTTVAEIAARAGLTERTFFRHFADKREVLFAGGEALQDLVVEGIAAAPPRTAALDAVAEALRSAVPLFEERRVFARQRHALIAAHPELLEREVMKLTSLASAAAAALRDRGVAPTAASLAAEAGVAVFKAGFERWIDDPKERDLAHHMRAALDELRSVVLDQAPPHARSRRSSPSRAPSSRRTSARRGAGF
ncbi:MAG TPA: TetR family transcriptional regulator [Myxococcales bacterium]|nr:TetR family transcriptional regulator [Myxococcales bacterium]